MTQRILFPKKATWEELNSLSKENIEKIIGVYKKSVEITGFSRIVGVKEVIDNDYNYIEHYGAEMKKEKITCKTTDEIRKTILEFLYGVHKRAKSLERTRVSVNELKKGFKKLELR